MINHRGMGIPLFILSSIRTRVPGDWNSCWEWEGAPVEGNVYRIVAEACDRPLPTEKLYRMPECKLGKACVNPSHLGTGEDYVRAAKGQRPEQTLSPEISLQDHRFLKSLKVVWDVEKQ